MASFRPSSALDDRIRHHVDEIHLTPLAAADIPVITRHAIEDEIRFLKNRKAPGLDGITAQHLRHIPERAVLLILAIFNACLRFGYFSSSWKDVKVVSICKPGKPPDNVASYRFLNLLSILQRCLIIDTASFEVTHRGAWSDSNVPVRFPAWNVMRSSIVASDRLREVEGGST